MQSVFRMTSQIKFPSERIHQRYISRKERLLLHASITIISNTSLQHIHISPTVSFPPGDKSIHMMGKGHPSPHDKAGALSKPQLGLILQVLFLWAWRSSHGTRPGCKTSCPATPHMRVHSIKEDCCAACTREKALAAGSHEKGLSCVSPVLAVLRPSHVCATTGFSWGTVFQPSDTQRIRKKGHLKTEQK